jgi:hypothetical protein
LLRGRSLHIDPANAEVGAAPNVLAVDDLAPARGVVTGVSIGVVMWAAIVFAIWQFM